VTDEVPVVVADVDLDVAVVVADALQRTVVVAVVVFVVHI
jgi:hypothetical protein